ncbi:deoxyribonuclease-1-like 1 isoform X3 [Xenopus tropicalis]|uniref:Deoxyribonuclease n=1 Tax=Xenopus tropicalis TaxID=8364 RepID=A0A803JDR9_XENTR|nr:deoxyribonuclease-1-like 1 isoform X3 [Xenopus tropicalis]
MASWAPIFFLCAILPCICATKICAFNMQHFGEKKVAKDHILELIVKIVQRCEVSLLQEVQDPKGLALSRLLQSLNRSDKAQITQQYKYADDDSAAPDVFAREPYIVRFNLFGKGLRDLVLVPMHTVPENASREIDALYDVFLDITGRWDAEVVQEPTRNESILDLNILFLGDFNAACSYLSKKKKRTLRLYRDERFHWLIDDTTDTTVRDSTSCAYDRIVAYGKELMANVQAVGIYNFTKALGLSEIQALEVSDHYPVELDLNGRNPLLPSCTLLVLSFLLPMMSWTWAGTPLY